MERLALQKSAREVDAHASLDSVDAVQPQSTTLGKRTGEGKSLLMVPGANPSSGIGAEGSMGTGSTSSIHNDSGNENRGLVDSA